MNAEDLIFYSDNENKIYSGGFNVNSVMLKQGLSPIVTLNQQHVSQKGGTNFTTNDNDVSDLFNHLVVPNWAFTTPYKRVGGKKKDSYHEEEEKEREKDDDFISEDLHSKLLSMVKVEDSKKLNIKANKKTKTKNFRMKNTNNKTKNNNNK
jgi:hypothetical protein